jgi:hypothetical protein
MTGPRKAKPDDVVRILRPNWGVVVAHRPEVRSNQFGVVSAGDELGRRIRGPVVWMDSNEIVRTGRLSKPPGRLYRALLAEGGGEMTGCACLCGSPHLHLGFEPDPGD